jgi:hypothetical protein
MLPRTGYSFREIDQAVALGIGIITLILSTFETILESRFAVDVEFEGWRCCCIENIELGDTKIEVARWRDEADHIEKKRQNVNG